MLSSNTKVQAALEKFGVQAACDFLIGLFLGRAIERAMLKSLQAIHEQVGKSDIDTILWDIERKAHHGKMDDRT